MCVKMKYMDTLLQANIFFFIASIGTIIFIILGSIALYYLIHILKNVKEATDSLRGKIETASEQVEKMRQKISESLIFNLIFAKKPSKKRKNN